MQEGETVYTNKFVFIINDKFTKWRKLKELKLVNNSTIVNDLFSSVEHSNEQLECEISHGK